MTQRATLLRIPQPCAESWDAMTPTATGRHCAACQKTVVDFTQKTDVEILAALRQAAGETCGRLRPDQLARPLLPAAEPSRWRSWLAAVLALGGVLGSSRAAAQAPRDSYYAGPLPAAGPGSLAPQPASPATPAPAVPKPATSGGPATLRGVVTDATTHEGLPGVTVLLAGTSMGTSTDASGAFALPAPAGSASVHLAISSVGYVTQEQTATVGQPLAVVLTTDTQMLGGMIACVVYQRPWPWHPRRFFNWSKYWLTRPFRN